MSWTPPGSRGSSAGPRRTATVSTAAGSSGARYGPLPHVGGLPLRPVPGSNLSRVGASDVPERIRLSQELHLRVDGQRREGTEQDRRPDQRRRPEGSDPDRRREELPVEHDQEERVQEHDRSAGQAEITSNTTAASAGQQDRHAERRPCPTPAGSRSALGDGAAAQVGGLSRSAARRLV